MGTLYVVGTPIGNLEDITYRALRILREVDLIAAEDTRQTRKLLTHFDIHTPLISYHQHNQATVGRRIIDQLSGGQNIALVTDAGMPGISDPGEDLVRLSVGAGVRVVPIPGPTALATALAVSGLASHRFAFEGFLPAKRKDRRAAILSLLSEPRTWILYEAPHRIGDLLTDLAELLGDRRVVVARELTKLYEEVVRGTPAELAEHFRNHPPRGEFVVVVSGHVAEVRPLEPVSAERLAAEVSELEETGVDRKEAMKQVGQRYGLGKRDVYQALLSLKEET